MRNWFKNLLGIQQLEEDLKKTMDSLNYANEQTQMLKKQADDANKKAERLQKELEDLHQEDLEKRRATEKKEPYITIKRVLLDPSDPGVGGFELDWNEYFVARLVRSGYAGETDEQIVDQWFQTVCKHVVLETYEQYEANQTGLMKINKRQIDESRSEFS